MNNKILNLLKSIGIIFLMLMFSSIFFMLFNVDLNNITEKEYIYYLTGSNLALIIIFLVIYRKTLINDLKPFFNNISENLSISFKYWATGFGIMIISNLIITFILNKGLAGNEQNVRSYIDSFPAFMIFNSVIYAPLIEELTFRKSIRDAVSNKWIFILVSGLVFGGLHIISYINNWSDIIYLIPYGSLGISFAMLYYKTNNIYSTISMHAMHNLLAIVVYLTGASI